ncbi:hypothetical protein [Kribbella sp. NPDC051770]
MTTNPIPPIVPTGPGSDPDENPDLVDPALEPNPDDAPEQEDPNEQLPRE